MNIYFVKRWFLRKYYRILGKNPADMNMVKYWKKADAVKAKSTTLPDGSLGMYMEGEDYPIPGISRGHMLFGNYRGTGHGPLSVLKHTIKDEIFNYAWYALEAGKTKEEIINTVKNVNLPKVQEICDDLQYDMIPPEKMFTAVRELWRAFTVLEKKHKSKNIKTIKEALCFTLLDDDAYINRVKWIIQIFNPSSWWSLLSNPFRDFDTALQELEVAEITSDMKGRVRLLRAGLSLLLSDKKIRNLFLELCKEVDWRKLKITDADLYHLRAKYFKADLIRFEY